MPWKKTDTGIVHFVSTRAGLWTEIVSEETHIVIQDLLALAQFGGIYLNDSRIFGVCEIREQDYLRIHTHPRRYPRLGLIDRVIFANDDLLILNKPAGLPCHPTVDNLSENLWYDLQVQLQKTFFPTHRLDVPTSGLIVFAKNAQAQVEFQNLLKNKQIEKIYQALVSTPGPDLGLHEHYMEKTRYAPKTVHDRHRPHTQVCLLKLLSKEVGKEMARLEIELVTGRTHQIRAQLSFLGYPILGDTLYSDMDSRTQDEVIQLRCMSLRFPWNGQIIECKLDEPLQFI